MDARPLVLLVEDEPMIAVNTAELLGDEGFSVILAWSSAEAFRLIAERCDDLSAVFVDINLHDEMTGFDVARTARRECPGIGVIYTSGGLPEDFDAQRVPGGRFLDKPYSQREAAEILRGMIDVSKAA